MWMKSILFFEEETKLILKLIVKVREKHTQDSICYLENCISYFWRVFRVLEYMDHLSGIIFFSTSFQS